MRKPTAKNARKGVMSGWRGACRRLAGLTRRSQIAKARTEWRIRLGAAGSIQIAVATPR